MNASRDLSQDDQAEDAYWTKILGFPLTTRTFRSRNRYEDPPEPPPGPRGLELARLDWALQRVAATEIPFSVETPFVADPAARFAQRFPKYIEHFSGRWRPNEAWWASYWTHIPYDALAAVFTQDELSRLSWSALTMNEITDAFEADPYPMVLHKIHNSMWHWGWVKDYNRMVGFYEGFRRFTFAEGFEVRLDHVNGFNDRGHAVHHRDLYLDGEFGLIVYAKGVHVLTIGLSVTRHGILLHQVQLRQPKGNRWLFRLPKPLLEFGIDRLQVAFPGETVCLVDGASNVAAIRRAYGPDFGQGRPIAEPGVGERIAAFYDQPLQDYVRGEPFTAQGLGRVPIQFARLTWRSS